MDDYLKALGFNPQRLVYGNPVDDWFWALALGLLTFAVLLFLRRRLKARTKGFTGLELPRGLRLLLTLLRMTQVFPLLALSLAVGSKYLELNAHAERLTSGVIWIMLALQLGVWASAAVRFYLDEHSLRSGDRNSQTIVTLVQFVANLAIWSLVLLLVLDNLGFQVKALVAGLGIGGIAVALAVQNILGDLLASVSIALDEPFGVGDALTLDSGYSVTVEAIGIKSTRLRSVTGEQIVVANAELVKTRIRNFGRLAARRSVFRLVVSPATPAAKLAEVPGLVCEAVERAPMARFERAHLMALGLNGPDFEVSFVVDGADYAAFLDAQQVIHLAIAAALERQGIELAKPQIR